MCEIDRTESEISKHSSAPHLGGTSEAGRLCGCHVGKWEGAIQGVRTVVKAAMSSYVNCCVLPRVLGCL